MDDELDEDIDPLEGPIADLMAEHNLSSAVTNFQSPPNDEGLVKTIEIIDRKIKIFDYLSIFNIRLLFKNLFDYILDIRWYYYMNDIVPKHEQDVFLHQQQMYSSMKKLSFLFIVYAILTSSFPLIFHFLIFIYILILLILDFLLPLYIYHNWFECLKSIYLFLNTIQTHRQWLIKIHGFQLIRPTSSLFENQLLQLRRTIFEELQQNFLYSRQIARQYSDKNDQLICYINLDEYGPLIQLNLLELEKLTNQFDQPSIYSILKLCHLQINECIQQIHLKRPNSFKLFPNYNQYLLKSIEKLTKTKQNCSIMMDYINLEKCSSKKLTSSYFLLRSNSEQLFEMNEKDSINNEQLKRIIQDLKTVIYSLEAIQSKPILNNSPENNNEQILSNEINSSNISSFHRFDDQIEESIDEILICDTGKNNDDDDDDMKNNLFDMDEYDDQRLLREQTNYLMKELQTAIQGKKQEWNERERRLLGNVEINEDIQENKKQDNEDNQPFERMISIPNTISMLDELKHTFVLNRNKLNIDEDIFGEDEEEIFNDS